MIRISNFTSATILAGRVVKRKRRGKAIAITPQLSRESCQKAIDLPLPKQGWALGLIDANKI